MRPGVPMIALAGLLGVVGLAVGQSSTPMPLDLKVVPPGEGVPKAAAAFSGTWVGLWGNQLDHTLVVEKIEGATAQIVYSWGTASAWNIRNPGFVRVKATINEDNILQATLDNGAEVAYKLSRDQQSLSGQYILRGRPTLGTFTRQK